MPVLFDTKVDQVIPKEATFGLPETIEDKTRRDYLDPNKISIPVPGAAVASMPVSNMKSLQKHEAEKEGAKHRNGLYDLIKPPLSNGYEKPSSKVINFTLTVSNDQANGINPHDLVVNHIKPEKLSGAAKLQRLLKHTDDLVVCPGVYDGFSARIAMSVGFQCLYMTGAGTTASRLGMADLAIAQLHDMREHADMIANLDPVNGPPLIADMDTGYGGPIMVANSVAQYIRAGVAGFHIEDQVQNKRCGHLKGKKVVEMETYLSRIRAAKGAINQLQSDIVLIARTDALQQHGYDECIARLKAARDIGADVGLLEGFTSKEMARRAVKDLAPWPLLLNMVENGATPIIPSQEAKEMGFRIMIFSFASLAPAYTAIKSTMEKLKAEGVTGTGKDLTPIKLFEVCGLKESMKVDFDAGGLAFAEGV